ncbi:uncharacterized protein LY89DRAFT_684627 [Mollisia scopiformis]|uniref:Uncharacterized protein n=1 Tax=Mollisia scopiformis TaxID=149040 RepID=A0A194XD06_MOLSC|nr:uncharacterized protein LY89DRAFT_684627 [Mollisia scopiformis]KUJ17637.1 hypothetical protein LY89DRAFT_684627 [Mollisia scopiformis]
MNLFLLPALLATSVFAAPYLVPTYVVLSVYTEEGFTDLLTTVPESRYTYTEAVVPATPVLAITTITTPAEYTHVTILDIVVPSGSPVSETYDSSYIETSFVVPVTYTPDATCTSQNWTFTTNVPVYVPDIVSLSPVTTSLSATTYSYEHYNPTPTTNLIAVLNPTDVNADDLASASSEYAPYGMSYCYTPTTYCPTASAATCTTTFVYDDSSSGYYNGDEPFEDDDNSWLTPLILICVLVPVGWFLIWLLIGLWESWMSFKGLMLGQHRKRGLPYAWCCISVIFLCWVGPTYKAKGAEEQAELAEKWKAMGKREKFKLWMKWGFRWKYPDMIGEEPEYAKRAFRQGCL